MVTRRNLNSSRTLSTIRNFEMINHVTDDSVLLSKRKVKIQEKKLILENIDKIPELYNLQ